MNPEDTGKFNYQVHVGTHNDDQKGFSLVKGTEKVVGTKVWRIRWMGELNYLFPFSRSL